MTDRRSALAVAAGRRTHSSTRVVAALAATLGPAALGWIVAIHRMDGMDMGVATELGSFASFIALWLSMMAAMMLPSAAPTVARRACDGVRTVPLFVAAYLAVWMLVGVVAYVSYRPHGTLAAGVAVLAAGVYELTPVKRRFRQHGHGRVGSGLEFGVCCVGSTVGLMLMLVVLGPMNLAWMSVVTVLVAAQTLLRPRATIDVPLALAVVGLGVLILAAPSSIPGLTS